MRQCGAYDRPGRGAARAFIEKGVGRIRGIFVVAAGIAPDDTPVMTDASSHISPRRMTVLAYPDVQILDVVGPLQVFCHAGYPVEIIGVEAGPVRTSSGMQLVAERGIAQVGDGIDTLLVAGGNGFPDRQPTRPCWSGFGPCSRVCGGLVRSAPGHSYWRRRGCWTATRRDSLGTMRGVPRGISAGKAGAVLQWPFPLVTVLIELLHNHHYRIEITLPQIFFPFCQPAFFTYHKVSTAILVLKCMLTWRNQYNQTILIEPFWIFHGQ